MKKVFILMAFSAVCAIASAQMTYRVVYIPGTGEHQFGFSLAPSFVSQHLGVSTEIFDVATNKTVSYDMEGLMTNFVGIHAGVFYGYETVGRTLNWGNHTWLYYGVNPFAGDVSLTRSGTTESHNVSLLVQQVQLRFNPFLSYRINDQFSVNAGVAVCLAPMLPSKVKVDGQAMENSSGDAESWILMALLNSSVDATAGVKYWFSDELYVGFHTQYAFVRALNLFGELDAESEAVLKQKNGAVKYNLDKGTGTYTILPKTPIQAIFSVGFVW